MKILIRYVGIFPKEEEEDSFSSTSSWRRKEEKKKTVTQSFGNISRKTTITTNNNTVTLKPVNVISNNLLQVYSLMYKILTCSIKLVGREPTSEKNKIQVLLQSAIPEVSVLCRKFCFYQK